MKIKILFLSACFLGIGLISAQTDTLYVVKAGVVKKKYNVKTEIDSIIFYNPVIDVPFFDLTNVEVREGLDLSTASAWNVQNGMIQSSYPTHKTIQYMSPLVGKWVGLEVTLPPSYGTDPNKRYPVVYDLHGRGETDASIVGGNVFKIAYDAMVAKTTPEFIYIQIGGPDTCWWVDGDDGVMAESHFIKEILSFVDQKFRTLPKRGSRAIQGFSMGGWGATKIAFKYPEYFSAIASFCGALYSYNEIDPSPSQHIKAPASYGYDQEYTSKWSRIEEDYKLDNMRYLAKTKTKEIIDANFNFVLCNCGSGDNFYNHNNSVDAELTTLGIPHKNILRPVGHSRSAMTADTFVELLKFIETN